MKQKTPSVINNHVFNVKEYVRQLVHISHEKSQMNKNSMRKGRNMDKISDTFDTFD